MTGTQDEELMALALAEAEKGLGRTSPNPAVGAVLARNGVILGHGWHQKAGTAHAEIQALADARARGHDPRGATLYVTLEPCNHRGRTPPCTEAILAAGIAEVVIGTGDPNRQVRGGGADFLAAQGVQVRQGILQDRCRALILPFAKHSASGLPWVLMKAGLSLDGKISWHRGQGGPITGPEAGRFVHRLRNRLDAILVGVGTALVDNPALTCRLDAESCRDPVRVILDSSLRLPPDSRLLTQQSAAATLVFCGEKADAGREKRLADAGAHIIRVTEQEGKLELSAVLQTLGQAGLCSVLVEGGAHIHAAFLAQALVDEVALVFAPYFVGESGVPLVQGPSADGLFGRPLVRMSVRRLGADILVHGYCTDPDSLFPET